MRWIILPFFIVPSLTHAQEAAELTLVKQVFTELQPKSIRWNREYCGYIGYDQSGQLIASRPTPGKRASCLADEPENIETILSSYHTHGAFSYDYANEVPSGDDMEGDEEEGIDGWVATPGGRLWYIDTEDLITTQICGIGCLPMDKEFEPGDMGHIAESYSYNELVQKLEEGDG
ncbi:DUF4329 domain-containing protein [Aliiroseovarius sp. F20344]|uniref:DUF4329 domain-containing protein n=1 Tax=Aliiroseovarius sp. F20344 TaxID=2926414 RepID=UPI001FF1D5CC|nr:DUF4329 domain-containing protein [Aliiroseovarius sp. F20344]